MSYTRKATHSGEWYPTDNTLGEMLDSSFAYAEATTEQSEGLKGIISPHSCYQVCLRTAAHGYARINPDSFERVFVLGTCHHVPLRTFLFSGASSVETPFGDLDVESELIEEIIQKNPKLFSKMSQEVDEAEHSLEMQFPLIKFVFGNRPITVVPVLVGALTEEDEEVAAGILQSYFMDDKTFFVVSSDFTHYGELFKFTKRSNPRRPLEKQMEIYDSKAIDIISSFNYSHFRFLIEEMNGSICGCYSIQLMMHIFEGHARAVLFNRSELCPVKKPSDFSISYVSIGFYEQESEGSQMSGESNRIIDGVTMDGSGESEMFVPPS